MDASTRRRAPGLQEPEFFRPGHGLSPAPDFQLAVNVTDVLFNRIGGHHQLLRDLLIGITGGYPPLDIQFALT